MAKVIEIDKTTSRKQLDEALNKNVQNKSSIDLTKYAGKVKFGVDGLAYQQRVRC